jgi:ABC-2 type transport system ATP-binding protein
MARIGYVSESQHLPDWLSADGLLDYLRPFYPTWDDDLCRKVQTDLGLTATTPLRTLSRGTRMKAALLASLAYRPELVLLDEPFTGLDPMVRDELIRALLELPGQRPCTVLISSHDIEEVERLADWVGFIDGGRLTLAEPVDSLLQRFRLIEVTGEHGAPPLPSEERWLLQGTVGRMLRFIDTDHGAPDAQTRIAAAFPAADVRDSPLTLRDIFVALARASSHKEVA